MTCVQFKAQEDTSTLYYAVSTARVTKSAEEIEAMRYSAYVASNAHVAVMRTTQQGAINAGCIHYFNNDMTIRYDGV